MKFDYSPVAYTGQFWIQENRSPACTHCALRGWGVRWNWKGSGRSPGWYNYGTENWSVSLLENDKICIILPSLWVILVYTRISILYENCAFLPIFWGGNGTVILVGCNSPFCENCFSLRFRDFSKSRSNENYFSQTFSRLKASSRKINAWRLRLEARTARLTARTAPSNGPDGPSNGPPNGPDGGAGDRRLRPG